jgi:hypothetical protein
MSTIGSWTATSLLDVSAWLTRKWEDSRVRGADHDVQEISDFEVFAYFVS